MQNIPLFKIYWDEHDIAEITTAVRSGVSWAIGSNIEKFEKGIAEYIGTKYAVVFNSGTSALHAALLTYELGEGAEVIVPSFTFIATANAALFVGAKPVFAEIEEETYGLDPVDVRRKITPKTRAIIPIHYGGCPCLVNELKQIVEEHGLILIEDAAEAFGAAINGKKVGSFGDAAILSFCQNKVITTGEGGAVVTNSSKVYEKLKLVRSHGRLETANYFYSTEHMDYMTLGYNFRMSNITASLGIAQLNKVDRIIEMRRKNAQYMTRMLSPIRAITTPYAPNGFSHVYQMYTIRLRNASLRDSLMKHLSDSGIMTHIYFPPVHLTRFYRREFGYREGNLPTTEKVASEVLTLPMYPTLTKEETDYIGAQISNFFA
jgi:perosamine synthetase